MNSITRRLSILYLIGGLLLISATFWRVNAVTCVKPDVNGATSTWAKGASIVAKCGTKNSSMPRRVATLTCVWAAA